eukprot:6213193-Pleurochrysis_carterae.AAC.7
MANQQRGSNLQVPASATPPAAFVSNVNHVSPPALTDPLQPRGAFGQCVLPPPATKSLTLTGPSLTSSQSAATPLLLQSARQQTSPNPRAGGSTTTSSGSCALALTSPPAILERRPPLHGATEFISWTWEMVNDGCVLWHSQC